MAALVQVGGAFRDVAEKAHRRYKLSSSGAMALAVLEGSSEPLSPTAIAERLLVTTASMTSLLDTLERRGLLRRQPNPDDRRKLLVALTDEGRAVVDRFLPEVVALQTAVMAELSESERAQLLRLVSKVRAGIANLDFDAIIAGTPQRGRPHRG